MPRTATFYTHVADVDAFACRLASIVYDSGTQLLIWCADEDGMARLSEALWLKNNSFLAHEIAPSGHPLPKYAPLILSLTLPDDAPTTVLNLSGALCDEPQVLRVLEMVTDNDAALVAARLRFAAYRQSGFVLEHHNMYGK